MESPELQYFRVGKPLKTMLYNGKHRSLKFGIFIGKWRHKMIYVEVPKGSLLFYHACSIILKKLLIGIISLYELSLFKYQSHGSTQPPYGLRIRSILGNGLRPPFRLLTLWHSAIKQWQNGWGAIIFDLWHIHDVFLLTFMIEAAVHDY